MMDLVQELRLDSYVIPITVRHAAADEIERLRCALLMAHDALRNLIIAAGEGGAKGRALDLLPSKYMTAAEVACAGAASLLGEIV